MADSGTIDVFGVAFDVKAVGADSLHSNLEQLAKDLQAVHKNADMVKRGLSKALSSWSQEQAGKNGKIPLTSSQFEETIKKIMGSLKWPDEKLPTNPNTLKHLPFAAFNQSALGKALVGINSLKLAFSETTGIYKFVAGIEQVNQRLLLLHYSSSVGVSSLKDMGAAASAFGGSAQSIASAQERLSEQLAKARRGGGFGFLQESYWKYGFQVDLGWNADQMRKAAIAHARGMADDADALAFAKEIDPANYKQIMAVRGMSDEQYARYQEMMQYMESQGGLESADGRNRVESVKDATQEYEMEVSKLKRAWEGVKDEVANALLPILTALAKIARSILDIVNKYPGLIKTITFLVSGMGLLSVINRLKSIWKWWGSIKTAILGAKSAEAAGGASNLISKVGGLGMGKAAGGASNLISKVGGLGMGKAATSIGGTIAKAFGVVGAGIAAFSVGYAIGEVAGDWIADKIHESFKEDEKRENDIAYARQATLQRDLAIFRDRVTSGNATLEDIKDLFDPNKGNKRDKAEAERALSSLESSIERYKDFKAFHAKAAGFANYDRDAISAEEIANITRVREMLINNQTSSIDNSKTQNQVVVNVNGAGDPAEVGKYVVTEAQSVLGAQLNGTGVK